MKNYITWLYFLVENQGKDDEKIVFLYGLTLPTKAKKNDTKIVSKKVDITKKIIVFSTTSEKELSRENSLLNFIGFIKSEKEPLEIINSKEIIQVTSEVNWDIPNSLTTSPLHVKCFYTEEFYNYFSEQNFENSPVESFINILKVLQELSGQNFLASYSKRLGCYEVGQPQERIEEKVSPFVVDTQKQEETLKYILKIDTDYIFEEITIHLIVYNNDNEIVKDIIKSCNQNKDIFLTEIKKEDCASLEYWIFNKEGKLIDRNKHSFIRSISLNCSLPSKTYDINSGDYSKKSPLKDKKRSVSTYNQGFQNNIEVDKIPDIEEKANKLYKRLKRYKEEDVLYKNGIWSDVGEHEDIINFLNGITSKGVYKIIFIDPFISSDASLDYLFHFKNQQIVMQFISCWETNISPDDSGKKKEIQNTVSELQKQLEQIKDFNIPLKTVQWYNFKAKKFHDRFIYIENISSAERQVYSMSNSLNNMLRKYNLTLLPLKGEVLKKALFYINNLILECTEENKIFPKEVS